MLMVATIGCDRVTKRMAADFLGEAAPRSFMNDTVRFQYAENTGGFLGLGAGWPAEARTAVFVVGNGLLLIGAIVFAIRSRWSGTALVGSALFVAGGASNLADRIARGSVVDFMILSLGPWRTGIFNVADMAIMLGMALVARSFWGRAR